MWKSYDSISILPEKYQHFTVNHSKEFMDKRTGCNTNSIESIWLKCKSKIRRMNGVDRIYLQEYLDEVMWRYNECTVNNLSDKKAKKYARRNAFRKMLNLINFINIPKLDNRIRDFELIKKDYVLKKK